MKKTIMLLLIFLCSANAALGIRVTSLYQGSVPAKSQSEPERNRLASQALAQVLVKVSGNNDTLNNPQIKTYLGKARDLMQEFSYVPTTHLPGETTPYLLQLNFDPEAINKILRDTSVPIWGQNRPLLIIWLDYEIPGHPAEMIGADSGGNISSMLKFSAERRGVPVIFPALDVEDLGQIAVNDIISTNIPKLMAAAKRYESDAILIGRITQDSGKYNTQWKLVLGNDQWGWNITGNTLPDIFTAMTDHVGTALAGRFATVVANTVQSSFIVKIIHVPEAGDFVEVMNYIKHLTPVADVQLEQVSGDAIILRISLRGTKESFEKALIVEKKLTLMTGEGNQSEFIYQWNH
ncbi:MAG TPA: DUF2066 domain-containing protein [Gammaproteobacteria bacterium]|nr:DUF2066 domain-containing protein [Gammaproteobacteria bacterium]